MKILGIAKSSYYNWLDNKDKKTKRKIEEEILIKLIIKLYTKYKGTYGYNRMRFSINKELKTNYSKNRIYRIMRENNLLSVIRPKKVKRKAKKEQELKENILNRDFSTTLPKEKLSTDITEIKYKGGKLYLSGVIDIHTKNILTYSISDRNDLELVFKDFNNLVSKYDLKGSILQSDRGFQYTSIYFSKLLKDNGIIHSMSRPGKCPDNSPIESFWGILKSELVYNEIVRFNKLNREEAIESIEKYIEYYNNERIRIKEIAL